MELAEILQKRIKARKDKSDDEAVYDTDPVEEASEPSAASSVENTDVDVEGESQEEVRSLSPSTVY